MTRVRSLSRGLTALIGLAALIVGVPAGLTLISRVSLGTRSPLTGVDAPWRWSMSRIRSTLTHHLSEATVIDATVRIGVCLVWVCLVVVLLTIIAELISQLRHGVSLPTIRGLVWSQRIAAGVVAGLLAFTPMTQRPLPVGSALPLRDMRPTVSLMVPTTVVTRSSGDGEAAARQVVESHPGWRTHRVGGGESIWDIGSRLAGGDTEETHHIVRQILDANLGERMIDGAVFEDPGYIEHGWLLSVPVTRHGVSDRVNARRDADTAVSAHIVVHGDTLWDIIEARYGHVDAHLVWQIAEVNHLDNPASLSPGTRIELPQLGADGTGIPGTPGTPGDPGTVGTEYGVQVQPGEHGALPAASGTVVVQIGDTLSSIADREYGDANLWPTLFDANRGRRFADRVFTNPNVILPGWILTVPDDAAALPSGNSTIETTTPVVAPPTVDAAPASPGALPPPRVGRHGPNDPDALPTWTLPPPTGIPVTTPVAIPAIPATTTVTTAVAIPVEVSTVVGVSRPLNPPPLNPPPLSPPPVAAADETLVSDHDGPVRPSIDGVVGARSPRQIPLGPTSAIVLATGAIGLIEGRRRRRLRAANFATLPRPEAVIAEFESQLRRRSNAERLARLDLAVRCAAPRLTTSGRRLGAATIAENGEIDLYILDGISSDSGGAPFDRVPPPFRRTERSDVWRVEAITPTEDIDVANRFASFPSPTLAHLGSIADADVFIDLEANGLVTVVGDSDRSKTIVQGVVGSLSLSPFAETVSMLCTGMPLHADALPRINHYDTMAEAFAAADQAVGPLRSALQDDETTFALRTRSIGETWEPAVVSVCGPPRDVGLDDICGQHDLDEFASAITGGRGVALVIDRDLRSAGCRLSETSDGWLIEPYGLVIRPVGLTEDELIELDELIASADAQPTPLPLMVIADHDAAFQEMPWSLMVRVLGPVDVVDANGVAASMTKSKSLELTAWLAEHRHSATRSGARAALWESEVRDATFANVVSEARRSLARLVPPSDGMEWIARTLTEQLPLHSGIVTDAAVLQQRLDFARACRDADEAVYVLRPGLELVRDVPYTGVSYLWADAEGSISNLTLLITSAAAELARRYLALHDIDGVFWATGRGLQVLPGHEDLIALRMRARAVVGDLAGVRTEWESYERVLNADSWSDGEPSSKMMAVRRELLKPSLSR